MADINITGNSSGGRFNVVRYNLTNVADISSFNTSLCAIQTISNTQQTLREYRPDRSNNPFTQFVPGSGYVIIAKENFTLTGTALPEQESIEVLGNDSGGRFNIVQYTFTETTNISSFNTSLCAIQTISNTQQTLREYRPDRSNNPFTQFVPNSGYIVVAKQSFTLTSPVTSDNLLRINGNNLVRINGNNLVPIN